MPATVIVVIDVPVLKETSTIVPAGNIVNPSGVDAAVGGSADHVANKSCIRVTVPKGTATPIAGCVIVVAVAEYAPACNEKDLAVGAISYAMALDGLRNLIL